MENTTGDIKHPNFTEALDILDDTGIPSLTDKSHNDMLNYFLSRIKGAESTRQRRLARQRTIDKSISTWQRRNLEESERLSLEEATGKVQGIPSILPLMGIHLDDMVAYFSEIFTPEAQDIYNVPSDMQDMDEAAASLVKVMNRDARHTGSHVTISSAIRSALKYNLTGIEVTWSNETDSSEGGNRMRPVDMYNATWDPTVQNLHDVSEKAEWFAQFSLVNRKYLVKQVETAGWDAKRVQAAIKKTVDSKNSSSVYGTEAASTEFYVHPPTYIGIEPQGEDTKSGSDNFAQGSQNLTDYFPSAGNIQGTGTPCIEGSYELTHMYIWFDPSDFGANRMESQDRYELYSVYIVNSQHIVYYERLVSPADEELDERLPVFMSHYIVDELGAAQRSPMELMSAFQRFASFLLATWIELARKRLYGVNFYDPSVINPKKLQEGQVHGWIPMQLKGRDIRTAVSSLDLAGEMDNIIGMLGQVLNLVQTFFPSQNLPAQIAGIDRAVKSQVSAVLNTGQARLRFQTRLLDTMLLHPVRQQQARNHFRNAADGKWQVLSEEDVSLILGSGLKSLNAERVENLLKEVLGFVAQSEVFATQTDLPALFDKMTMSMNLGFKFSDFMNQPELGAQQGPEAAANVVSGMTPEQSPQPSIV